MRQIVDLLDSGNPDDRRAAVEQMLAGAAPMPLASDTLDPADKVPQFKLFKPSTWKRIHARSRLTVDEIVVENARFDHSLKKTFGRVILWLVISQIALANLMILSHFFFGAGSKVESSVLIAWISGTVVESIGLMTIVTKYLFNSDRSSATTTET